MLTCNSHLQYLSEVNHIPLIIIIFFLLICCSADLSFNFTGFNPNSHDINCSGNATFSNSAIQLTKNQIWNLGRATYFKRMQLWDKASGNLADFNTHFSFIVNSENSSNYADGFTFFLAPDNFRLPIYSGGGLGLIPGDQKDALISNPFVAVEFDTCKNVWDPPSDHVGINIDSMESVATVPWFGRIPFGQMNEAWINYNSSAKNLSVAFTSFPDNVTKIQHLSYVVDLSNFLPEWVTFGFSAATGAYSEMHTLYSWNFSSRVQIHENNSVSQNRTSTPAAAPPNPKPNKINRRELVLLWLIVGIVVLVVGMVFIWAVLRRIARKKKLKEEDYEDEEMGMDDSFDDDFAEEIGPKRFTYKELVVATNNFAEEGKLGQGGFGSVYRGFLADLNMEIAVKKISSSSKQGKKEYISEVKIISHLRHRNLVQLVGWSHERGSFLLVYEYMPNGSLDSHLFGKKTPPPWPLRHGITHGLASGLLYLHEEWEQCVVHRDIKSSNVMLDSNFNAKLGDFGLARLVDHGLSSPTTALAGTMGYMAPECVILTSKASKESDVFSFGVVALEISCGRKPVEPRAEESKVSLVNWVWDLYGRGRLVEAADERLNGEFDKDELICLMTVGLWCAHPDHNLRPTIRQAIQVLNFEAPLPSLPSQMPVPTYFAPAATPSNQLEYTWSSQATSQTATTSATSNESTLSRAPSTKSLL